MEKTGKQVLFSSDLIYTVLKKNEPDHILLKSSYEDAKKNMIDYDRLREILKKIGNAGIQIIDVSTYQPDLEDIFIDLTS